MRREIVGIGFLVLLSFCGNTLYCQKIDSSAVLTPFKLQSLREYVEEYGDILSISELSHVDGFTADDAAWMWNNAREYLSRDMTRSRHEFSTRIKQKYGQEGFSLSGKYFFENGNRLSAGVVVDNDPGEKFPDFLSAHIKYRNVVVGDYSARFGQGLILWKSFSYSAMGEPSVLMKRGSGIQGYKSTDEENNLRGIAASFKIGKRLDLSVLGSYKLTDVNARDSGKLHEFVAGANLTCKWEKLKVGITIAGYSYDGLRKVVVKDYNRLQLYDGFWGNAGGDFVASFGSFRLFGEMGFDLHGAPAALLGFLWSPDYSLEASFQARAFSPSYIATHSMEDTNNELGGSAALRIIKGKWKINLNGEYSFYPWYRYNKPAGGMSFKIRAAAQYSFLESGSALFQITYGGNIKMRLHLSVPIGPVSISARAESNYVGPEEMGHAFFVETSYSAKKIQLALRCTYYNTDGWSSRIYLYEKNTPQSFGSQVYYNTGIGGYLVARYSPIPILDLYLKVQQNYSAFFMRIIIPG